MHIIHRNVKSVIIAALPSFSYSVWAHLAVMLVLSHVTVAQPAVRPGQQAKACTELRVARGEDFVLTGDGQHAAWSGVAWTDLHQLDDPANPYASRFKIRSSATGIYLLFDGRDKMITTEDYEDFGPIFNGDVFEVFFYPDPAQRVYFEYEINPLGKELVLMLSNTKALGFNSWVPRNNKIQKKVVVNGGPPALQSAITSWTAEVFIPYTALSMLPQVPPAPGTTWRANFCRLDYDTGKMIKWSWSPGIQSSFHEIDAFCTILFE